MSIYFELNSVSPKKGEPPFSPSVYIALKRPPQNEQGKLFLSPMLMSEEAGERGSNLCNSIIKGMRA